MTTPTRSPLRRFLALLAVVALATLGHTACCGCTSGPEGPESDLEARYLPADLRFGDQPVAAGAEFSARFDLVNRGPEAAPGSSIHLSVPASLRLVSVQCTAIGTATCPPPGALMDSGPVAVGSGFIIHATVAQVAPARGEVEIGFVGTARGDRNLANNAVTVRRTLWSADRRVSYGVPAQARAGDAVEWLLTVENFGPDVAAISPAARFPVGIEPGIRFCREQGGSVCVADTARGMLVPPGARSVIVFPLTVPAGFSGDITSTADDGLAADPSPADNSASATLTVN